MKTISALTAGLLAVGAYANEPLTPEKAVADIKTQELQRNLWNLNKIARDNGGNRAFGLPGYEASGDYILERVQKRFATTIDAHKQYVSTPSQLNSSGMLTEATGFLTTPLSRSVTSPLPAPMARRLSPLP